MKHPGGEVHLLEGLMSGAQLFPRHDALTAAAQAGAIHELRAGDLEGIGCVGEGGLVRLYCGLVVGGGEPPTSCHQRPQPWRCCRQGDGRELLSHRDGIVLSSERDVCLDEIGSGAEWLAHRPNATVGGDAVLKQRHGHRRVGPTQGAECSRQRLVGAKPVVSARLVSDLARLSAMRASS